MNEIKLLPLAGINVAGKDEALQVGGNAPRLFVRDAVNVDIAPSGMPSLRPGLRQVSAEPLANLWQSPLHGDTFATLGDQWVKVDTGTWGVQALATMGEGAVSYEVLNNAVVAAGPAGIFRYDGMQAQRLTLEPPAPPMVQAGAGALDAGAYGVAVAWLRGAVESPPSAMATCTLPAGGGLQVAIIQLAITLGASIGGVLFDGYGWRTTFLFAAMLLVGSFLFAIAAWRLSIRR